MIRRGLVIVALAAVCIGAFLLLTSERKETTADAQTAAEPIAETQAKPPDCGPDIPASSGHEWACTFADDFDGRKLDERVWSVMETEQSGFTHATECYIDDPSTVEVRGGFLELTARKVSEENLCGTYATPYVSGMIHSQGKFAQTYGRFEARIKFPEGVGFHGAWWMWPQDMAYGRQSGEIDIAEHWGMYPEYVLPYVHIIGTEGEERGKGTYCAVNTAESEFHTYTVEWTPPGRMVVLYDGNVCMTFEGWDPGDPLAYPQPFDQPFFLLLTLALQYGAVDENTPFPATMTVDYVRGWAPVPVPEPTEPPPLEPSTPEPGTEGAPAPPA